jgi:hypothetical protein
MEVEYELTPDDLYAFQWRAAFRRDRLRPYAYWLLTLLLFSAVPAIGADGFVISRMNFTLLVVGFPILVLAQWYLTRSMMRRAILRLISQEKPDKGLLGWHQLVLSESGLVEKTAVGESHTAWAGVDRVEQNPEYIFIYTSAVGAHIIPKRAFKDIQEAEGFYQRITISKSSAA